MYLVEALKYDVPALHEDRLTQILAATFNDSPAFRRLLLLFLGVRFRSGLTARTQVANENAPSRPDLIIYERDRPFVLIESKVEAKSDRHQQTLHAKMNVEHCFLIVRDPINQYYVDKKFKKVVWSELFSFIRESQKAVSDPVDSFLLRKLLNFAKECRMVYPDRISKSDFENASALITELRLKLSPAHAFEQRNPFQSLDVISQFLERTLLKVKDDDFLGTKLKPFVRRLGVSSQYFPSIRQDLGRPESPSRKRELALITELVTIEKVIRLKRPAGELHYLFVRASFVPYFKGKETTDIRTETLKKIDPNKVRYRCEVVAGLCDAQRVSDNLIRFDDKDDLEFSTFYKAAARKWRRKLG